MHSFYLLGLLTAIGGLTLIDYHYKLVWFRDWRRAAKAIGLTWLFFVIWDIFGIRLDIFAIGNSPYMLGWQLIPHLPIEELFFLMLLSYMPLVLYQLMMRWRHV